LFVLAVELVDKLEAALLDMVEAEEACDITTTCQ